MKIKDKQSYNVYTAYGVEKKTTILLELNQILEIYPGDIIIQVDDLKGFMMVDKNDFEERFEVVVEER